MTPARFQKGRNMPTTGNVTANEISVTFQAQASVENMVSTVKTAIATVSEAASQLGSAMATTAGAKVVAILQQWVDSANDIANTGSWMASQLGITGQQLQAGNQQAEEMAAALPAIGAF
jgi:hypothetical protein